MKALGSLLRHYWIAKRHKFANRAELETHQQRQWQRFVQHTLVRSTYFRPYIGLDLQQWPLMNKALMLEHFADMNTVGVHLQDAFDVALKAEQDRNFQPTLQGLSVGLSSGTSASRGVFVVSPAEQAQWAAAILAKLLPNGLLAGERVALVLRANNNLYQRIDNRWIAFQFFDLLQPFALTVTALQAFQPSIVVAPVQVLRALSLAQQHDELAIQPKRVIAAAEVLSRLDRDLIAQSFPNIHQVYQATEGFLAASCTHGRLHWNEEYLILEREWLDDTRYIPIITDFTRTSQPIIRYRLDDVIHDDQLVCPCGRVTAVIGHIEGRLNDVIRLPSVRAGHGDVCLFADALERIFAQNLPLHADYQLTQTATTCLHLQAEVDELGLERLQDALIHFLQLQHVDTQQLKWQVDAAIDVAPMVIKRRRIQVKFTA